VAAVIVNEPAMTQLALQIAERSQIGEARRQAAAMAASLGFGADAAGRVALAVTEAATNVVRHAGSGEILLRPLGRDGAAGIELIALDRGPGMANVAASRRDGHSTAGSPGQGLGAIGRAALELEIWSQPGKGTVLRCELWPDGARPERGLDAGAVGVAKPGEAVSGDDWMLVSGRGRHALLVVDGLGHGPDAAAAARAATGAFARSEGSAAELLGVLHDALRSTRGAAAAVALMQPAKRVLDYAGVGNVSAAVSGEGRVRHLVSHNGILGHGAPRMRELAYPFPAGALLVMHTDGVATHWDLGKYAGLESKHPAVVAAVLYRDHLRGSDDATVVVVRNTMGS
jgi:anti-sigma regulatory factor (Ser/Thr protein kinase)